MYFVKILALSFLAAAQASCVVIPAAPGGITSNAALVRRDDAIELVPRLPVECGNGVSYDKKEIDRAFTKGKKMSKNGEQWSFGNNKFPKNYGSHDTDVFKNLPKECKDAVNAGSKLIEFPIKKPGPWTDGTQPGYDRVLMLRTEGNGQTRIDYCGVITHRGADGNFFKWCPHTKP
ncbi:uncharacterized protein K452DRAFT_301313 [Aplosporella prunicola CBS 121167]|uniref:ribonuclease T1 n=1 Tax=Aplosporella prunicola CBS 121167 TaxID=1176127 RepID=A0A6A6B6G1_9PEZI|nr:uncharacterized protein K452DRAFT_301313 [Aplosporella prunicola CBS 121167]KAF2138371.1 hypothetical protein K452DRAFT_301313 [Aplosporella prunicola CBS 121167]